MKKLANYFSLLILLCSFVATPITALAQTVGEPPTGQIIQQSGDKSVSKVELPTQKTDEQPVPETSKPAQESASQKQDTATTVTSEQPVAANKLLSDTGAYSSQISDADSSMPAYYGGDIITLYNGVSISGNVSNLNEGSYTVISLPKNAFDKPQLSSISTSFPTFKNAEIKETDTDWQIVTTYKSLPGGYSADTPFKINLTGGKVVNATNYPIHQDFYSVDNQLLSSSDYDIKAKAIIENGYSPYYESERLTQEVDANYIVKDGTSRSFSASYFYSQGNRNDPRDRRVIATIPEGAKLKAGSDWIKVPNSDNQYYKDIPRDQLDTSKTTVELDLSGMDLSNNDSTDKTKNITVSFSMQPVVNGEVQTDIPANTWSSTRRLYILKKEPEQPSYPAYVYLYTSNLFTFIDPDYAVSKTGSGLYLSGDDASAITAKGRQSQQVVNYAQVVRSKNEQDPVKFTIKTSQLNVSNYINPTQLKISLVGLSSDDQAKMISKLNGTKAYGIKADGSKTLLSDNIVAESASDYNGTFTKDGWVSFSPSDYQSIQFEYPNGGLSFDKTEYDAKIYQSLYTSVVGDVNQKVLDDLKAQLPNSPAIYRSNYATVSTEAQVHENDKDETMTTLTNSVSSWSNEYYYLQYDSINSYNTYITNGSSFYTDDAISVNTSYYQDRIGNAKSGTIPKNLNIYYLIPDGLDPIEDPATFESLKVIPAYVPGYNLVIAKPVTINVPNNTDYINDRSYNGYMLNLKVNSRLPIGSYVIRTALAIDNNLYNSKIGASSGIIQYSQPYSLWANITTNADNRSENPNRFTDMGSSSFNIYPNKVLVGYKSVKLASESDDNYASSLGQKGKIGSDINYQLRLVNNSTKDIDNITLIDTLPQKGDKSIVPNDSGEYTPRGSMFSTPLTGSISSDLFDIYYSVDTLKGTIDETKSMNWVSTVDDYSKVTAIKAVLKPGKSIKVDGTASITLNSRIEDSNDIQDGDKALNSFAYSRNDGKTYIEALGAEVIVNYDKKDITLNKFDKFNPELKLEHAVFDLYDKATDKKLYENIETNTSGQAVLKSLVIGKAYYLKEVTAPQGYNKLDSPINFTVTNDLNTLDVANVKDENITISGQKTWDDNNNQDGKRPNQVTINLLANGKVVDTKTVTSQDNWAYNFTEKPKYQDGKEILYTITEDTVPDYNTIIDGFNVTNSYTPGQTSVTVTKNWVDDNNNDQIRPDQIKVQLLADGKVQGDPVVLNQASQWQYTWNHLPEKANGQDIVYSVEEVKVDGYTSTVNDKDKGNIILTNTHASATTTINGTKTWDDNNNQAGNRPNSITVNLLADGKKVTDQVVKADQNGKWLYAFKDMPKFSNGKAIVYSVTEEAVKNYKSSVTGFNITNKYITLSTTPTNGNSPTNGSSPTTDGLPSTGEASQSALILLGGLMLALLVSYIYYKKRQV